MLEVKILKPCVALAHHLLQAAARSTFTPSAPRQVGADPPLAGLLAHDLLSPNWKKVWFSMTNIFNSNTEIK